MTRAGWNMPCGFLGGDRFIGTNGRGGRRLHFWTMGDGARQSFFDSMQETAAGTSATGRGLIGGDRLVRRRLSSSRVVVTVVGGWCTLHGCLEVDNLIRLLQVESESVLFEKIAWADIATVTIILWIQYQLSQICELNADGHKTSTRD